MTSVPPPDDESIFAHVGRVCKNSITKCFGTVQTSDEVAKIKYKEYQIDSRKKKFGVEYLKLVHEKASEEALKACLDAVLADTAVIEKEIEVLRAEIDRVNAETKKKIIPKPGTAAPAAAAASTTTTPAATDSTTTTPAAPTPAAAAPVPAPVAPTEQSAAVDVATPAAEEVDMQEVALEEPTAAKP